MRISDWSSYVFSSDLWLLDIDYDEYLVGGSVIAFFVGPATVALAVPLHRQPHHLRELLVPMLVALPVAAFVSISSGMLLVRGLGGDQALERTMAPKSATTPIAIGITEQIGGITAPVAVFTPVAGIIGAVLGPPLLDRKSTRHNPRHYCPARKPS